ncbi:MAG TPA: cupin domain-containing protein [Pyrinomonadaceae bacterium]
MAVKLAGHCWVRDMREGVPALNGTTKIWQQIGKKIGAEAICLRVIEFGPGIAPGIRNESCDEVLYFLEDESEIGKESPRSTIYIDGWARQVGPQTGIYLAPGSTLTVENLGQAPVVFISSRCPEPQGGPLFVDPLTTPSSETITERPAPFVALTDRPTIRTGNRWYRVLVDEQVGSRQVTQFVGSIPPGRAPDHFHNYEEVLFILRGEGLMWADNSSAPLRRGSCVYLPKQQVHCVENIGTDELRLLGVFYPAGSPSVRYDVE